MHGPCWTFNTSTKGIGRTYPQHQTMGPGYDFNAANSVHQLPYESLPEFEPNFNTVVIHGHAKLTDLLSSAPIKNTGYLVSKNLRAILEQFSLPLHRYYSVPVTHRGKAVEDYYWLHLPQPPPPLTETSSIEEAEAAIRSASGVAALDLLRLYQPSRYAYCFVTDRLKQAMEAASITGVRFGTAKLFRRSSEQ